MPSKYKTIDGKKCEADLLALGEKLTRDAALSIEGARSIWEEALDGNKVTQPERCAIEHIMKRSPHGLASEAKNFFQYWLKEETVSQLRGAACVTVDGVRCDEAMIKVANHFHGRKRGPLGIRAAEGIWFSALDGRGVTNREKATIDFILRKYRFDDPGRSFLESKQSWLTIAADALAVGGEGDRVDGATLAAAAPDAIVLRRTDAIGLELSVLTPQASSSVHSGAASTARPGSGENLPSSSSSVHLGAAGAAPPHSGEDLPSSSSSARLGAPGTNPSGSGEGPQSSVSLVRAGAASPGPFGPGSPPRSSMWVRVTSAAKQLFYPSSRRQTDLRPGSRVRLHSLTDAAFNDLQGTCEKFDDTKQRWVVRLSNGDTKAFKPNNIQIEVRGQKRPAEESAEPPAKRSCDVPKINLARLRDMFDRCDINKDGRVNKRELIRSCRQDEEIASFFQLPGNIRQEDGSRGRFEEVFQAIDQDGDREIRWAELLAYYRHRVVDV